MRLAYAMTVVCLLLSSCIVEVPVSVPAQHDSSPAVVASNEWNTYADKVAYQYALFLVAVGKANNEIDAGNLYGFDQEIAKATRYLWEAANIDYPRDCRKCTELNKEIRKLAQAHEMLEDYQDMSDSDFEYWFDRFSDSKTRVDWLVEQ